MALTYSWHYLLCQGCIEIATKLYSRTPQQKKGWAIWACFSPATVFFTKTVANPYGKFKYGVTKFWGPLEVPIFI